MILKSLDGTELSTLSKGSKKKVLLTCDTKGCLTRWETNYFHATKKDSHFCKVCLAKRPRSPKSQAAKDAISRGVRSSTKFQSYVVTDERRQQLSETMKELHRIGKVSPPVQTEEKRLRASLRMMGNQISKGESGGYCQWYEIDNNGSVEKVQGTWELAYAKQLIADGFPFKSHPGFIEYIDKNGVIRRYFPDFQRLDTGEYIDVKNPFCLKQDKEKLARVMATGVCLTIVTKEDLQRLGIL